MSADDKSKAGLFGTIDQLAYVVPDVDAAVSRWVKLFGAGPFFIMPGIRFPDWKYKGEPQDLPVDIVVGQLGSQQIEFIRPHRDIPSVYRHAMSDVPMPHHLGLLVDDLELANAMIAECETLVTGRSPSGTPFTYNDTRNTLGMMVELIQRAPDINAIFELVRNASVGWDGRDPLRTLP